MKLSSANNFDDDEERQQSHGAAAPINLSAPRGVVTYRWHADLRLRQVKQARLVRFSLFSSSPCWSSAPPSAGSGSIMHTYWITLCCLLSDYCTFTVRSEHGPWARWSGFALVAVRADAPVNGRTSDHHNAHY